jgi:exopolysaccharide biosynthesis protein
MSEEVDAGTAPQNIRARRRGGCLRRLIIFALLAAIVLFVAADYVFNLRSNATYLAFRSSKAPLEAKLSGGTWKPVSSLSVAELDHALVSHVQTPHASWKTLRVRRAASGITQKAVQSLFAAEVCVVELSPTQYFFSTSFRANLVPTTARERREAEDASFAVTANFREPNGKPLGLVMHEGQQVNRPFPAWTGYFFVKAGKPWFGPKSLFEEAPGVLQEAAQVYPSLMKNHTVFNYVDLAPNKFFDGDRVTFRSLAGMRQDGTIVFILSGNGGMMDVAEIAALAQKLNVQHATLLDGGRALQYSLKLGRTSHHFTAFNTLLDLDWKGFEPERSPVFIVAKPAPTHDAAATSQN